MKKSLLIGLCACLFAIRAGATVYTLTPNPSNLGNLDHTQFYTWGLNWSLPQGEKITGATLTFNQIWDWTVEPDTLFIHLLDTAPLGVYSWTDNQGGGDFFSSSLFNSLGIAHTKLGEFSDPYGGNPAKAQTVSFAFNTAQLTALQGYITSLGASGWGNFGFGLDPDCHYFNNGVTFQIVTTRTTNAVPEGGSAALCLLIGFAGVVYLRRKVRSNES
jgi:hypothetical protein